MWRSWLPLAVAVCSWSLSPLLIVSATKLATAPVVALYAVALGALFTVAVTLPSKTLNLGAVIRTTRQAGTVRKAIAVGIAGFVGYPLLYFAAINQGPPAAVNLVNYLWPIVGILTVARFRAADRSLEVVIAGAFGFAGAALAIIGRLCCFRG